MTTGNLAFYLREDIWEGMRFYQSLAYANNAGIQKFYKADVFEPKLYYISSCSDSIILRTPEAHDLYLTKMLNEACSYVYMFSPFIRLHKLKNTFSSKILSRLQNKQVKTVLITRFEPCKNTIETSQIFRKLDRLEAKYPYFSYQIQNDFLAKTLITDNSICEGSFNWLSAVGAIDHQASNYEVSVGITGDLLPSLYENFQSSVLGQMVKATENLTSRKTTNFSDSSSQTNSFGDSSSQTNSDTALLTPEIFDEHIEIYSGELFNKPGFCVKLDGEYIQDESGAPQFYQTREIAKDTASAIWLESSIEESSSPSLKRDRAENPEEESYPNKKYKLDASISPEIPSNSDEPVYSQGFCVNLQGECVVDSSSQIKWFETEELAAEVASSILTEMNFIELSSLSMN